MVILVLKNYYDSQGDLKTIVEHNLPIKIAIMNNDAQMMVTIWEKLFFEERYTATLNKCNPNFVTLEIIKKLWNT